MNTGLFTGDYIRLPFVSNYPTTDTGLSRLLLQ